MPTYSYRCTECGHAFDIQQAFTDDSLTECPDCGGSLRKVFNSIGVSFTGSGFYRNDSRAEAKSEQKSSAEKSPASPTAASADSAPSTPATKTPAPSTSAKSAAPAASTPASN